MQELISQDPCRLQRGGSWSRLCVEAADAAMDKIRAHQIWSSLLCEEYEHTPVSACVEQSTSI